MNSFRQDLADGLFNGRFGARLPWIARTIAPSTKLKNGATGKPLKSINAKAFIEALKEAKRDVLIPSKNLLADHHPYNEAEEWHYQPETCTITFKFSDGNTIYADALMMFGEFVAFADVLWGWADERHTQEDRERLHVIVDYGRKSGFEILSTAQIFGADSDLLFHVAALAAKTAHYPLVVTVPVDDTCRYYVAVQPFKKMECAA